jgi:hypothetical protein
MYWNWQGKVHNRPHCSSLTSSRSVLLSVEESNGYCFLLKREPKESILRSFDLTVISRYFPEYEREMTRRL